MIASLPMYWRAENAAAWRRFWAAVQAAAEIELPDLTEPDDLPDDLDAHWLSADLVLSQTCGLPLRTRLKGRVQYVGTFDFGLECPAGYYYSIALVRPGGARAGGPIRLAYSVADSQSGWAASREHPWRDRVIGLLATGSHEASAHAVAEGRADMAFVDAVTWRLLERFTDLKTRVEVVDRTAPTPGLPLITALGSDPEPLRQLLAP